MPNWCRTPSGRKGRCVAGIRPREGTTRERRWASLEAAGVGASRPPDRGCPPIPGSETLGRGNPAPNQMKKVWAPSACWKKSMAPITSFTWATRSFRSRPNMSMAIRQA